MSIRKKPGDTLTPQEVELFARAIAAQPSEQLAIEIGRYQVAWSQLEQAVGAVLRRLLRGPDDFEFAAIKASMSVYDQAKLLKVLSRRFENTRDVRPDIDLLFSQINGTFRNFRNRLMHDTWLSSDEGFEQITNRVALDQDLPSAFKVEPVQPDRIQSAYAQLSLAIDLAKSVHERLPPR